MPRLDTQNGSRRHPPHVVLSLCYGNNILAEFVLFQRCINFSFASLFENYSKMNLLLFLIIILLTSEPRSLGFVAD